MWYYSGTPVQQTWVASYFPRQYLRRSHFKLVQWWGWKYRLDDWIDFEAQAQRGRTRLLRRICESGPKDKADWRALRAKFYRVKRART